MRLQTEVVHPAQPNLQHSTQPNLQHNSLQSPTCARTLLCSPRVGFPRQTSGRPEEIGQSLVIANPPAHLSSRPLPYPRRSPLSSASFTAIRSEFKRSQRALLYTETAQSQNSRAAAVLCTPAVFLQCLCTVAREQTTVRQVDRRPEERR